MAINDGINNDIRPSFDGLSTGIPSAPGSPGLSADETSGPAVGSPEMLISPQGSSQIPANLTRVTVTAGDTSGMSSDNPAAGSAIMPADEDYLSTGAGQGMSVVDNAGRYPWQQSPGGD